MKDAFWAYANNTIGEGGCHNDINKEKKKL